MINNIYDTNKVNKTKYDTHELTSAGLFKNGRA